MAEFVRIAGVDEIPVGEAKAFEVKGQWVAVFHTDDGSFYALDDICTHEEASLAEGDFDENHVECPMHGARFDLKSGKVLSLPAVVSVKSYPVRVNGSDVEVEV